MERARIDFGGLWEPPGCVLAVFGVALGHLLAVLGRSWVSFEHLLAALGHLLVASGCACVPPGWILKGFGYLRTTFWSVLGPVLDSIFGYNAFIAARCPAWISHTLFLLTLQRGGTCAAHGIKAYGIFFHGESDFRLIIYSNF